MIASLQVLSKIPPVVPTALALIAASFAAAAYVQLRRLRREVKDNLARLNRKMRTGEGISRRVGVLLAIQSQQRAQQTEALDLLGKLKRQSDDLFARLSDSANVLRNSTEFHADLQKSELILVLSLPKCGSSTLHATLRAMEAQRSFKTGGAEIMHLHHLTAKGVDSMMHDSIQFRPKAYANCGSFPAALFWLNASKNLREILARAEQQRRISMVGGVREPIGLLVSLWFYYTSVNPPQDGAPDAAKIAEWTMSMFRTNSLSFLPMDHWFDQEVLAHTGIDVMGGGFEPAAGFKVHRNGCTQYGVIRLDDIDLLPKMLAEMFDVPAELVSLRTANRTSQTAEGDVYSQILKDLRFPAEFVRDVYSTRYARTFWTSQELETYAEKWTGSTA